MDKWAESDKYDCHFICICVVGNRGAVNLAKEMGTENKMSHCVNGFIDNQESMPEYGQLGCQGFIILDAQHKVVSRATSAFMEVRDLAFAHVESLLDAVSAGKPLPAICPGEFCELTAAPPDKPVLLGKEALCTGFKENLLSLVLTQGSLRGKQIQVPASMVRKLGEMDSCSDEETGSCGQGGCGPGGCGPGGCGSGGCDKPNCDPASCGTAGGCNTAVGSPGRRVDESLVNSALQLVSVKVPSMDAEHDECAAALRRLAVEQSHSALLEAMNSLLSHFEHEESLFEDFGYGGHANDRFSATTSHIEDHRRIVSKMQRQLAEGVAALERDAALEDWLAEGASVPAELVEEVLKDFHEHTSRYDVQYAEFLSSRGAK